MNKIILLVIAATAFLPPASYADGNGGNNYWISYSNTIQEISIADDGLVAVKFSTAFNGTGVTGASYVTPSQTNQWAYFDGSTSQGKELLSQAIMAKSNASSVQVIYVIDVVKNIYYYATNVNARLYRLTVM